MLFDDLAKIARHGLNAKLNDVREYDRKTATLTGAEADRHFLMYCLFEGLLALRPAMDAQKQSIHHGYYRLLYYLTMARSALEARHDGVDIFRGDLPLTLNKGVKEECRECVQVLLTPSYERLHAYDALMILLAEAFNLPQIKRTRIEYGYIQASHEQYRKTRARCLELCENDAEREALEAAFPLPATERKRVDLGRKTRIRAILSRATNVEVSYRGLTALLDELI